MTRCFAEPRVQAEGNRGGPPALEFSGQHLPVFRGLDPVLCAETPDGADLLPRLWGPAHILTDLVQGERLLLTELGELLIIGLESTHTPTVARPGVRTQMTVYGGSTRYGTGTLAKRPRSFVGATGGTLRYPAREQSFCRVF